MRVNPEADTLVDCAFELDPCESLPASDRNTGFSSGFAPSMIMPSLRISREFAHECHTCHSFRKIEKERRMVQKDKERTSPEVIQMDDGQLQR